MSAKPASEPVVNNQPVRSMETSLASAKSFDLLVEGMKLLATIVVSIVTGALALIATKTVVLTEDQLTVIAVALTLLLLCTFSIFVVFGAIAGTLDKYVYPEKYKKNSDNLTHQDAKGNRWHEPSVFQKSIKRPFQFCVAFLFLGLVCLFYSVVSIGLSSIASKDETQRTRPVDRP